MQSMRFWNCPYAAMIVEDYGDRSGAYHLARSQAAIAGDGQAGKRLPAVSRKQQGGVRFLRERGHVECRTAWWAQIPGGRRRWPYFPAHVIAFFPLLKCRPRVQAAWPLWTAPDTIVSLLQTTQTGAIGAKFLSLLGVHSTPIPSGFSS